ncbi:MAG: 30S ribosomal protein S9 [Candidatus Dojkabacteria bacterium]
MKDKYFYGLGRRKTTSATVRVYKGKGESVVNDKLAAEVFPDKYQQHILLQPLRVLGLENKYYFTAKTNGGGTTGMIGAIALAMSRALVEEDESRKPELKKYGLMTRDDRMVERKKTGLRKARKAPQFSKR